MSSPDKAQVQTDIKLEDGVTIVQENVTDIQNYLDTFNKEIQGGDQIVQQVGAVVAADDGGAEEGTYYVDQAGQYYYQSPACDGQQVMTVVSGIPGSGAEAGESFVTLPASAASAQRDNGGNGTPLLIQTTTSGGTSVATAGGAATSGATDGGGATYQTVTIVPSETNPGELSYLLIVQQPGDDDEGQDGGQKDKDDDEEDHDLTVYDFDDAEDVGAVSGMESGEEDDKTKIVKFMPKKSQTVTQAHMCNYCNYTSPKRYLLSRHMKSHSEERPHKCSVCERGFKTLASLQNHVNTHTGTKPHRCKHCDSAFTTSGELVRHVRYKHTHEKPHKCTICDYASVELSKMRNHMRCHTGERPYQVAAQLSASSSSGRSRSKRSLAWDYFTEIDDKSAVCLLCSRVIRHYNGTRNLLKHVRRVHVAATSKHANSVREQDDSDCDVDAEETRLKTCDIFEEDSVSSVVELSVENSDQLETSEGVEISGYPESSFIEFDSQTNGELEISGSVVEISGPSVSSIVEYEAETSAGLDISGLGVEIPEQPIEFGSQSNTELRDGLGVVIAGLSVSPVIDYADQTSCGLEIQSQSLSSALDYDATTVLQRTISKESVSQLCASSVIDCDVQTNVELEISGSEVDMSEHPLSRRYVVQTAELENGSGVEILPRAVSSVVGYGNETSAELGTVSSSSNSDNLVHNYGTTTNQDDVELETVSNVVIASVPDTRMVECQVLTDQEVQCVSNETIFPHGESPVFDYESTGVQANSEVQHVSKATISPIDCEATTDQTNSEVQPVSKELSQAELLVSDYEAQTTEMNTVSNVIITSHPVSTVIDYATTNSELDTGPTVIIESNSGIDYGVSSAELQTTAASISPKPAAKVDSPKPPSTSDLAEEFPLQKLQIVLLFFEKIDITSAVCTVCHTSIVHKGCLKPVLHHLLRNHRRAVSDAMLDQASCVAKLNSVYENLQEAVTVVLTVFEKDLELWSCDTKFKRVWKYFYRINKLVAMCLLCFCDFKISKTVDKLSNHLKRCHPSVSVEDLEDNSRLQGGNKRKCKVVSDEVGNVWAYFVKKNDRIALCTLCPTNLYFFNNKTILSNHLRVKHGMVCDSRFSSDEDLGSKLLKDSENNDKKVSESSKKVVIGRKFLEISSKVAVGRKLLESSDKVAVKKRLLETSNKVVVERRLAGAVVGRILLESSNKTRGEKTLAETSDEVVVERKLLENSSGVLVERSLESTPKVIVGRRLIESSSEVTVEKRLTVSSPEVVVEGRLSDSPEVIIENSLSECSPEVIVENYDSRKSLKLSQASTTKRHSVVWQHFKEVNTRLAHCILCKKNVESFGSTGALLKHLRKLHADVLGENGSNSPKPNQKCQRSFVWEYFTRKCQKSSICSLCKLVVRGENTGNLIDHLKRRHKQDLLGKPIGLWVMGDSDEGRKKKNKKDDEDEKKMEKKKKGGKKLSIVWLYFIEKDDRTASCSLCKRDIKHYKTTKNLLEHLRRIHPQILKLNKDGGGGGDDDYVTAGSEIGEELPFIETVTDADFQPSTTEVLPPQNNCRSRVVSEPRGGSGDKSSTFISKHFIKFQDNIYLCKSCQNTIENVKNLKKLSDHLRSAHKGMLDEGCVAAAIDNLDDVSNSTCASSAVLNSELNTILETLEKSGDKSEEPMTGFGNVKRDQHQSIVLKSFSRKDETTVTCLFCNEDIERFCGINNLLDHLESKHPEYQLVDSLTIPFAATTSDSTGQLVEIDDDGLLKNLNTFDCSAEERDHRLILSKEDDVFLNKNFNSFNCSSEASNHQLSLSKNDEMFVEKNLNSFGFSSEASDQQIVLNRDVEMFVENSLNPFSCNSEGSDQQLVLNKADEMFVEKNLNSFNCSTEATEQNSCIDNENVSFIDKETRYVVASDVVMSGKQLGINENGEVFIEKSDNTFATSGKQVGLNENCELFIEKNPNSFGKNDAVSCGKQLGINESDEIFIEKNLDSFNKNDVVSCKQINENSELFMETSNNDALSKNAVVFSGKQLGVNEKDGVFSEKSDNTFNTSDVAISGKQLSINEKGEVFLEKSSNSFNASDGIFTGKRLGDEANDEMFVGNPTYPFEANVVTANKQLEFNGNNVEENNPFDKSDVVISGKQLRIDENGDLFVEKPTDSYQTSGVIGIKKLNFNENNREANMIEQQTNSFNTNDMSGKRYVIDGNGEIFVEKLANTFETNNVIITEQQLEFNENSVAYLENETNSFNRSDTGVTSNALNANDMIVSGKKLVINENGEIFVEEQTNNSFNTGVSVASYNINDVIVGDEQLGTNEEGRMSVEKQANSFNTGSTVANYSLDSNDNRQIVFNENVETFTGKEVDSFMTDHQLSLNEQCEIGVDNETNNSFVSGQQLNVNEIRDEIIFVGKQNTCNFNTGEGDVVNVGACEYLVSNSLCGVEPVTNLVVNQLNNFNENLGNDETNLVENHMNFNENLVNAGNSSECGLVENQLNLNENLVNVGDSSECGLVENQLNLNENLVNVGDSSECGLVENQLNLNENLVKVGDSSECGLVENQLNFNENLDNDGNDELISMPNMDMVVDSINQMDLEGIADDFLNNVVPGHIEMSVMRDENQVENPSSTAASLTFEYQTKDDIRSLCSLICNCDVWSGNSGDIVSHMRSTHGVILKHSPKEPVASALNVVEEEEGNAKKRKKKKVVEKKNDGMTTEKKKPYKKRSVIWRHFVVKDEKTATCLRCSFDFSRSSSRNLLAHLRRKHAIGCEEVSSTSSICKNSKVEEAISGNSRVVKKDKVVRKSSVVWKYFKKFTAESDSCGYVCVLCNKGNDCNKFMTVLNMRNHLRQVHGIVFKKRAKRFSYVWKYFRVDDVDDQTCTCSLCGKELQNYSDVRVLKNHLKNSHEDVFSSVREVNEEESELNVDVVVPGEGVSEAGLKAVAVIEDSNIEDVVQPVFNLDFKRHKRKRSKVWDFFTDSNETSCVCTLCSARIKHAKATPNLIEHMRRVHPGVLSEDQLQKRSKEARKKSAVWKHFRKDDDENSNTHVVCKLCGVKVKHNRTTKKLVSHIRKQHYEVFSKDLVTSRESQTRKPLMKTEDLNNGELHTTITPPLSKGRKGVKKKKINTKSRRNCVTDAESQTTIPHTGRDSVKEDHSHTTITPRRKHMKNCKGSTIAKNSSLSKNTSVKNALNSGKLEVVKIGHLKNVTVAGNSNLRKSDVLEIGSENVVTAGNTDIQNDVEFAENHGFDPQLLKFPLRSCSVRLERCENV